MRTTSILACTLAFAVLLTCHGVVAQSDAPQFSSGGIEKEDIFELLTPLADGLDDSDLEVDAAPTPALQPTPAARVRSSLPTDRIPADNVIHGVEATRTAVVPSSPAQASVLSPQARLLLAPTPSPAGNSNAAERPPLLIEKPGLLTRLSQDELRIVLARTVDDCYRDLGEIQYGQRWQSFLHLEQLQKHLATSAERGGQTAGLELIRKQFLTVAGDPQYHVITKRPSFQAVHLTLNEYVAPLAGRKQRREAFDSLEELLAALRPAATGSQWLAFLKLAELQRLTALPGPRTADEVAQLKLILTRFQQAADEPQFKTVVALPGFEDTYRHLQQALVSLEHPGDTAPAAELSGKPLPDGTGPLLRLVAAEGACFHRATQTDGWKLIEQVQSIASGGGIRTAGDGSASLLIGEHAKLLIAPETTLSVSQYIDDSKHIVTSIDATAGNFNLIVDGQLDANKNAGSEKEPSAGQRIVIQAQDYRVVAGESRLALHFRIDAGERRAFAAVVAGKAEVGHVKTGDRVLLRPGREAVLVPQGIALRAAGDGPAASTAARPTGTLR